MLRQADEFVLLNELAQARKRSDHILSLIPQDLFYERPIRERHRLVFYLGHLEAFDANLLLRESDGSTLQVARNITRKPRTRDLHQLFAFGIDPVNGDLPADTREDWPTLDEVRGYVKSTRGQVGRHIRRVAGRRVTRWSAVHDNEERHARALTVSDRQREHAFDRLRIRCRFPRYHPLCAMAKLRHLGIGRR